MDLTICRQSVCMADDAANHTISYAITPSTKFDGIFEDLIEQGYFPSVFGNDVVWTLLCGEEDLMSWKTAENTFYRRYGTAKPAVLCGESQFSPALYFQYSSSPQKRGKQIFARCGGLKAQMLQKGLLEEYESYSVPKTLEDQWRAENSL